MATFHLDFYKNEDFCKNDDAERKDTQTLNLFAEGIENFSQADQAEANLSLERNLISWYEFDADASVLQIGAEFGGITEFLCEKCSGVTVAEVSRFLAEQMFLRYKEKKNLHIFAGNFNDMRFDKKFDYIILTDVGKYAGKLFFDQHSFKVFLEKLNRLLSLGGKLLMTAQNHYGLRFWQKSGADVTVFNSDDTGRAFSREELNRLLTSSGYTFTDFYYPYPTDRLPLAIYSDRFLPHPCDAARIREFYWEEAPFLSQQKNFIRDIMENDVFPFFCHSFFVEAGRENPEEKRRVDVAFFHCDRKAEYRIGTVIYSDHTALLFPASDTAKAHINDAHNNYLRLLTSGIRILDETLTDRGIVTRLLPFPTLSQILYQAARIGDTVVFFTWLNRFFENILCSGQVLSGEGIDAILQRGYPGMTFSNCFVQREELVFFRQEWMAENIPAGYVLNRALQQFFSVFPDEKLRQEVYAHFGFEKRHFQEYASAEETFCGFVADSSVNWSVEAQTKDTAAKIAEESAPQPLRELEEKNKELTQLYREALAYARGIETDPSQLGKKRIAKAFLKAFLPRFAQKAGSRILRAFGQIKNGGFHFRPEYDVWIQNSVGRRYEKLEKEPLISILVPLYNTDKKMLEEMITSCLAQTYGNFELCLADASDDAHGYVYETASDFAKKDARIKLQRLKENRGIAANTNACRAMASGEYLALLDHDDVLAPAALQETAMAIAEHAPDVLYSDEDHLKNGKRRSPFFKPDFNRDLLYCQMYICHFLVFKAELFDQAGQMRDEYSGSQDYDLMLRFTEYTDKIYHIPEVLYSWRETETSTSVNPGAKPYAHEAGRKALDAHLKRRYGAIAHARDSEYLFVYDARFDMLKHDPLISILIPTKDHASLLKDCVESILQKSSYSNFEIVILNNNSEEKATFACFEELKKQDERVRVIEAPFAFNWSKLNNFGMENSRGEVLIFLNNDTVVISPDWMERLAENALRPDVGAVGPLLLYCDRTIQHAGVVVGMNGWADHVYKGQKPVHAVNYFVSPMVSRDVLAVTGACMAVSRKVLQKIGGFDESFIVCGSDVEFCLRAVKNGLSVLYNARVRLYHMESKSRNAAQVPQIDFIRSKEAYSEFLKNGDPFYNKNLALNSTTPKIRL